MKIAILGAGAWGKAVGRLFEANGHAVAYLHHGAGAWPEAIDFACLALPVQHVRETLVGLPPPGVPLLSLSKGLEIGSGCRVSEIVRETWTEAAVGALSGPNFATEIVRGLPAAAVVAAEDEALAQDFQSLLHQSAFRLYRSTDLIGVELGGALKNIYAIAAGVCVGLELGENAFAALVTRCLAEMTRIGISRGGLPETFAGLSGVGDLMLTAGSVQSRNFRVGKLLCEGRSLPEILETLGGVAEGVATARSVAEGTQIADEEKPVASRIHAILYQGVSPQQAVNELLGRAAAPETRAPRGMKKASQELQTG